MNEQQFKEWLEQQNEAVKLYALRIFADFKKLQMESEIAARQTVAMIEMGKRNYNG